MYTCGSNSPIFFNRVGRTFPDRLLHVNTPLNVPFLTTSEETRQLLNDVEKYMEDVVQQEFNHLNTLMESGCIQIMTESQLALDHLEKEGSEGEHDDAATESSSVIRALRTTQSFSREQPDLPTWNFPQFQRSRLLLSHLGFLNFNGLKKSNMHLLAKSPALYRDIKGLDKKFG